MGGGAMRMSFWWCINVRLRVLWLDMRMVLSMMFDALSAE